MEIALVLTAIISLVVGVLLGRYKGTRRSQKFTHTYAGIVYWIEDDLVVLTSTDPNTGKLIRRSANITFIDEVVFHRPHIFWNGVDGENSVAIVVDWSESK